MANKNETLNDYDLLYREYVTNGLDDPTIADKYGVNVKTVTRARQRLAIDKSQRFPNTLTEEQEALLYSSVLGNGLLYKQKNGTNAEFRLEYGFEQAKYLQYKFDLLKPWITSAQPLVYARKTDGKPTPSIKFATIAHPLFTEIYTKCYRNGVKAITPDLLKHLSPRVLALWFGDSGSYYYHAGTGTTLKLYTGRFSKQESERLRDWLCEHDMPCDVYGEEQRDIWYIDFKAEGRDRFLLLIAPYLPDAIQSKLEIEIPPSFSERRLENYPKEFTKEQHDLIYGSLLGDACIHKPKGKNLARFQVNHCLSQADYLRVKFELLRPWINYDEPSVSMKVSGFSRYEGRRFPTLTLYTASHLIFNRVMEEFYVGGVKRVTEGILGHINEKALAYWFGDDGCLKWSKAGNAFVSQLSTESFTDGDNRLLKKWFEERWGLVCTLDRVANGRHRLHFSTNATKKLVALIAPFMPECMRHKVDMSAQTH